jgi:hypothetical protein
MSSRVTLLAGLTLLASLSAFAPGTGAQQAPHEHGVVHLDIAVEGKGFTVAMESPLDNFLGFEHAPRDAGQEKSVRAMAARLRAAETLFAANRTAGCKLLSVSLESAVLSPALLGEESGARSAGNPSHEENGHEGHADLDGSFAFSCQSPGALRAIDVMLFDAFERIRRIEAQVITPKGQGKRVLTRAARQVAW